MSRPSPFEQALREEEKWLVQIVNKPFPIDWLASKRVYIGPAFQPLWHHEREPGWEFSPAEKSTQLEFTC